MKTQTFKFTVGLLLLTTMACNNYSPNDKQYNESIAIENTGELSNMEAYASDEATLLQEEGSAFPKELKIIKNANCRFKVADVDSATRATQKLVAQYAGYISDMRFNNNSYSLENRFTVRIPQESFEAVMDGISDMAEFVDFKNITTKDVTEEYVDIEARLKTKLEVKARYEEILKGKAKTVEEVLMAEAKLGQLQEEIEAAQGRLKYLSGKVAYSTIQVDLYQTVQHKEEPVAYERSFLSKAASGFSFGWKFIQYIVLAFVHAWPLIVLVLGGVFWYRTWKKK